MSYVAVVDNRRKWGGENESEDEDALCPTENSKCVKLVKLKDNINAC